ncbi:hypothetical protein AMD27_16385 (plasmid) [Acinetobacter sp. TGL-Y2]|uniref:hypothetical protein n=1 Tax=Acinetobacter sp. TGL-Y2 TaxID=1407071 RepID=UPI0007A67A9B|nr:hypothetical protein [Acinetobacter sp. TGL-Y2]AMW80494.1 hypothetical protein AMD27_16385 [Acinetobacter sp. TGL-Y2]
MTEFNVVDQQSRVQQSYRVNNESVALALKELARIRNRPDGYSLEVVRGVRDAINNNKEHPFRVFVENALRKENLRARKP